MKLSALGILAALMVSGCVNPESDDSGAGLGPNEGGATLERAALPREADPSPEDGSGTENEPQPRRLTLFINNTGQEAKTKLEVGDNASHKYEPSLLIDEEFWLEPDTSREWTLYVDENVKYEILARFHFWRTPLGEECREKSLTCERYGGNGIGDVIDPSACPSVQSIIVVIEVNPQHQGMIEDIKAALGLGGGSGSWLGGSFSSNCNEEET